MLGADSDRYVHAITNHRTRICPDESGGGILADEMGMGKSLSILTLIVDSLESGTEWAVQQSESGVSDKHSTRSTLIVVSSARMSFVDHPL